MIGVPLMILDAGNESAYWDADYSESVSELEYNEFVAIDISK